MEESRGGSGRPLLLFNGIGATLELVKPLIEAMERMDVIINNCFAISVCYVPAGLKVH
jgi:hypothetical protein